MEPQHLCAGGIDLAGRERKALTPRFYGNQSVGSVICGIV